MSLDPYSQWLLYHGRDFDFAAEEAKEHPDDFSYVSIVNALDGSYTIEDGPEVEAVSIHPAGLRTRVDSPPDALPGAPANRGPGPELLFRLPLRHREINPQATPATAAWSNPGTLDASKAVILGIIDDGINVALDRFCDAGGKTRVDFAWIQDAVSPETGSTVRFGREWTGPQIDAARAGSASQEELFDRLGFVDFTRPGRRPLSRRASHGTHVLDLAAGHDAATASADIQNTRLISVQLPELVTQETSGVFVASFVIASVDYILARARLISAGLGQPVPVVLNFSYSISGGPHNGRHLAERAIRRLIARHKSLNARQFRTSDLADKEGIVKVVLPAGNQHQARLHAEVAGPGRATSLTLPWRLPPGDRSPTYLEIWLPINAVPSRKISLSVRLPGSAAAQELTIGPDKPKVLVSGQTGSEARRIIARASLDAPNSVPKVAGQADPSAHWRVLIAVVPTEVGFQDREAAPSGVWTVSLAADLAAGEKIQAWIQRDDAPSGYRRIGRQSFFDDAHYRRLDPVTGDWAEDDDGRSVVRRGGTLSGLATRLHPRTAEGGASDLVVAAGYRFRPDKAPATYSASASETMSSPDVMAVTDTSRALPGILAAGNRAGTVAAYNGTSVAAPQVARLLVSLIAATRPADRAGCDFAEKVRAVARENETGLPDTIPERRGGAGRLPVGDDPTDSILRQRGR